MTCTFHPVAKQELLDAAAFYRKQGGKELAKVFAKEIERIALLLDERPGLGVPSGGGRRSFPARKSPYSVIYFSTDAGIEILAIAHQMRRPEYWHGRK